MTKKSLILFDH